MMTSAPPNQGPPTSLEKSPRKNGTNGHTNGNGANGQVAAQTGDAPVSKHPPGLYVLFFTEMWERFSYYGMRALLVLYMIKGLQFQQARSSEIYGFYTGFVYATPIIGGLLADRVLGYRRTILLGGTLMMIGHFLMAVEKVPFFYCALAFLILGNGAFKPNISTIVGKLYKKGDPRRDAGFTIFYMGINLGAFFSPLVCGTLGEKYGWGWGFGAAGVGMFIGLITFIVGQRRLKGVNVDRPEPAEPHDAAEKKALDEEKSKEMGRVLALVIIAFFNIFFWAAFEQAGNTMTLWADQNTVRTLFGFEIPASWFQSVNPFFIFTVAPIISILWVFLSRKGKDVPTVIKMVLGLFFVGLGFLVLMVAAKVAGSDKGMASAWFLIFAYFLHTVGELCLSPIGLSLVTKLAPARLGGMLMGIWFLAIGAGNYIAGHLGALWEKQSHFAFFEIFVAMSVIASLSLLVLYKPLKKLIAGAA
jgi:POT family proton-dependent oligopeptide transporter